MKLIHNFQVRWNTRGGYKDVLNIATPLILSTGAVSIQQFVDRMFLTWYSPEAIAASVPAGILNFTILSLFIGSASFVSVFVAQYYGSGRQLDIGKALWQGIYLSLCVIVFMALCIPLSDTIFSFVGHSKEIRQLESQYFVILCLGGVFPVVASAIGGFFSGLGVTRIVMWNSVTATIVNIILDYILIFGKLGFPEMGITGAAIGTVISGVVSMVLFFIILFQKKYRQPYGIIAGMPFDRVLFTRLVRFGFPNGIQFFLDMLGFTLFILLIGRLGPIQLAATNVAININTLAFMPLVGCGIAVSVLVGQNLGEQKSAEAEYATWSAFHLCLVYVGLMSLGYLIFPRIFLMPFGLVGNNQVFKEIANFCVILLRFIAYYSTFDMIAIIFSFAIKGAGDTKFVMKTIIVTSWGFLIIPTYLAVEVFKWNLYVAWLFAAIYITALGITFFLRFKQGKWKQMLVIEKQKENLLIPENSLQRN